MNSKLNSKNKQKMLSDDFKKYIEKYENSITTNFDYESEKKHLLTIEKSKPGFIFQYGFHYKKNKFYNKMILCYHLIIELNNKNIGLCSKGDQIKAMYSCAIVEIIL